MITIEYDTSNTPVGSNSASRYIAKYMQFKSFEYDEITLKVYNISQLSNLKMMKAFIEDLIYLEENGMKIELDNRYE